MLSDVLQTANDLARTFPLDLALIASLLSPALLALKKWLGVRNERVMISLVFLASLGTMAAQYLLSVPTQDPGIIAVRGSVLAFMTQPVYFFWIKPLAGWLAGQWQSAVAAYAQGQPAPSDDIRSAVVPAGGIRFDQ